MSLRGCTVDKVFLVLVVGCLLRTLPVRRLRLSCFQSLDSSPQPRLQCLFQFELIVTTISFLDGSAFFI